MDKSISGTVVLLQSCWGNIHRQSDNSLVSPKTTLRWSRCGDAKIRQSVKCRGRHRDALHKGSIACIILHLPKGAVLRLPRSMRAPCLLYNLLRQYPSSALIIPSFARVHFVLNPLSLFFSQARNYMQLFCRMEYFLFIEHNPLYT